MTSFSRRVLRPILWLDCVTAFAMATSHAIYAKQLSPLIGLPATGLHAASGVALLAALLSAWLASRDPIPLGMVRLLAVINLAWVVASGWLVFGAGLELTPIGRAWILVQAAFVLAEAALEWTGAASGAEKTR